MKRCPQCNRTYADETLNFCLDDGEWLLSDNTELATAILSGEAANGVLSEPGAAATGPHGSESSTRVFRNTIDQTLILRTGPEAEPQTTSDALPGKQSFSINRAAKPLIAVSVAIVLLLGGFFGYRYFKPAGSGQINSIAVLPFQNMSGDTDAEYLSDGLAESLIFSLTQIPDLKVSPASSVMRYKGKETDVSKIASELGVDAVMTGRMTKRGENLNITVELVDVRNNRSLWGEQYERKMSDLLATQREIAAVVTQKLKLRLSGDGTKGLTKSYTNNNEAYQLYLKGRYYWNKRTAEYIRMAIEQFRSATELDPNFALAYSGLADCYALLPEYAGTASSADQARAYAERALELDDQLAEPHATLVILYAQQFNWAEAEREGKRVVELDPNYATGVQWYASILLDIGKVDEAAAMYKRASELDPLSGAINDGMTNIYQVKKDYEACIANSLKFVDIDPSFAAAHRNLAFCYLKVGRNDEAITEIEKAAQLDNRSGWVLGDLGYVYVQTGKKAEANAIIEELKSKVAENKAGGRYVAEILAGLDQKDQMIEWLGNDVVARSGRVAEVRWTIPFEPFHGDPRFREVLKRMNLPE